MTNESAVLKTNDRCKVKWREGSQELDAVILESRPIRKRRRDNSKKQHEYEYYVHYVEHDRRLDEWISIDQIRLDTVVPYQESELAESDRPIRRRSSFGMSNDENGDEVTTAEQLLSGGNWHGGIDPALKQFEREHEATTRVKNIERIIMGLWEVECWYYSPFPDQYSDVGTLYVCEYCLTYMKSAKRYKEHRCTCQHRKPPGKEIYNEADLRVYELDGKEHRAYCQKLCLLAKLFLDHKTLYYDVTPFLFYVVATVDSEGAHIVGYFSKEKHSEQGYNLACILTFPQYQKLGFGKFIISLSYEITKREGKTGSPEKPLSDLGKVSYRSYWAWSILTTLSKLDLKEDISIDSIAEMTGIKNEDLISTLQSLGMIKTWKGQFVVYVKQSMLKENLDKMRSLRLCKPECLSWYPPSARKENTEVASS